MAERVIGDAAQQFNFDVKSLDGDETTMRGGVTNDRNLQRSSITSRFILIYCQKLVIISLAIVLSGQTGPKVSISRNFIIFFSFTNGIFGCRKRKKSEKSCIINSWSNLNETASRMARHKSDDRQESFQFVYCH